MAPTDRRLIDHADQRPLSLSLLLIASLVGALAFVQVYSVQSVLPLLMHDFQASAVAVGGTVGATVLAVAVMSPFVGMLSDAIGRKPLIVGSVLFLSLPTALICGVANIEQMLFLRFLQGLAVPGITVVMIAYIGEEFHGRKMTRLMSMYVSGAVLGGFLGRFLMGYLSEAIGWRLGFLLMAGLSVAGAWLVWRYLPTSRQFRANADLRAGLTMLGQHLHNQYVLSACALGACVLFSLVGCFTYINLHLAAAPYRLNSAQLADVFAVYLLGVVVTPLAARLIIWLGAGRTILLAVALSVLGVLLTLLQPLWFIIVALALMSTGVFVTQSATINYIARHVSAGRSLASGLYYMAYYSGGTLGAWLCGLAYSHGGWPATVAVLVGVQVMAMLIAALLMLKPVSQPV